MGNEAGVDSERMVSSDIILKHRGEEDTSETSYSPFSFRQDDPAGIKKIENGRACWSRSLHDSKGRTSSAEVPTSLVFR